MPAIIDLRTSVEENHLSIAQMAERGITPASVMADVKSGHLASWVAEEAGEIAAFTMADRRDGSIFALFTRPRSEGRGLGSALLARAESWLAEEGHRELWLTTGPGTKAEAFYTRRGWTATDEAACEPGDIVFRKRSARSK